MRCPFSLVGFSNCEMVRADWMLALADSCLQQHCAAAVVSSSECGGAAQCIGADVYLLFECWLLVGCLEFGWPGYCIGSLVPSCMLLCARVLPCCKPGHRKCMLGWPLHLDHDCTPTAYTIQPISVRHCEPSVIGYDIGCVSECSCCVCRHHSGVVLFARVL
jgi:hypothetical protein